MILAAYHERPSLRGLTCVFGVARNTVNSWLKKAGRSPPLAQTLLPAQSGEPLELDELWSFVSNTSKAMASPVARTSGGSGWPFAVGRSRLSPTALADLEDAIGGRGRRTCRLAISCPG